MNSKHVNTRLRDVRYRGILAGIDPAASTIQLSNVYSMGTETRRPPAEFIPPVQEPYQYIIFRASEVKDLAVDEPTPRRSVHDDPAVLAVPPPNAHTPPYAAPAQQAYPQPTPPTQPPQQFQQQQQQQQQPPVQVQAQAQAPRAPAQQQQQQPGRRSNSVHTAAASLETVERALGDLRVSNPSSTRGRRGGAGVRGRNDGQQQQIKVPTTDFDFASSNAKFDKAALTPKAPEGPSKTESEESEDGEEKEQEVEKKEKEEMEKDTTAYNPSKSFFDSLSSNMQAPQPANGTGNGGGFRGGRRGGRGGAGRNRREEERERNVATFGEPGGVGLLGPGAYVGGWGGYGRRGGGGGRPRRGTPAGVQQAQVPR
ncbi:hypothetical protein DXG01_016479 [Tephrocybe rancida]|nr:hypothetical protein DXG01_016479 [Tephrocybe rancida]